MKALITGGAGRVGKATVRRMLDNGWELRVIGLEDGIDIPGVEYVRCDIMDYHQVREQMRGCGAVVHLAALAAPTLAKGHEVFDNNVSGTFHVFEAAAAEGIRRVAHASSINAFGVLYSLGEITAHYFPIDENHSTNTTDPYSFAKGTVEQIGEYFWRRDGISSVALRLPAVLPAGWWQMEKFQQDRQLALRTLSELTALPEDERRARLADVQRRNLAVRQSRVMEYHDRIPVWQDLPDYADPLWRAYAFDRYNFWAAVDNRDAAQAFEKGLTADYEGAHTLFINDSYNTIGYDSRTLVRLFFPEVSEDNIRLSGSEALVSIEKARRLIGFEPAHSVGPA
jgi:nucleoside-diphosphate-sugar epimerase